MLRLALAAVFAIHGMIHLLGFASFWRLAEIEGLAGENFPEPRRIRKSPKNANKDFAHHGAKEVAR